MIARALDHRRRARKPHGKALAGNARKKGLAAGGAVHHRVADNDVARGHASEVQARTHHHAAAGQALAGVIVGIADQVQRDALGQEGAKGLTARSLELNAQRVVRQAAGLTADQLARKHRADRAVDVACDFHELHFFALVERGARLVDQTHIERLVQAMVLRHDVQAGHFGGHRGLMEQPAEIEALGLPVRNALAHIEQVGTTDEIVKTPDAQLRHDLPSLLGHKEEVIDDMLRLARKLLAQQRILRGHADRAGVEMALAHHDAALDHQRRRGKTKLVGTEQGADDHITAGLHLAVGLHADAPAQAVEHQRLLRLGQTDFPGAAGVLDRRPGRGARTAIVAGDHHMVGFGLGHAGGDGAHAHLGDQLDADAGRGCDVLEVMNELRQILD